MTPDASPNLPPPPAQPHDPTRFVLVGTSHPGNVGAAARAMKVMGFADMLLAQGHTVLMHIRWPREVFELRKAGGELWQVGEGTVTMSHDDDVWPVEPDRHVRP